jgi:hypothetical protein
MVSSFSSNYSDLQNTEDPVLQEDFSRKWGLQCRPAIRGGAIVNWLRLVWGSLRHAERLSVCRRETERIQQSVVFNPYVINWLAAHLRLTCCTHTVYTRRPQDQMFHVIGAIPGTYKSFYHFLRIFPTWQILNTWLAKNLKISSRDWLPICGLLLWLVGLCGTWWATVSTSSKGGTWVAPPSPTTGLALKKKCHDK